jgi:sortase A
MHLPAKTDLHQETRRWARKLVFIEYVLLLAGLACLNYYIWTNTSAEISQAYESWSFSEELQGHKVSTAGFVKDEIGALFGKRASRTAPLARRLESTPKPVPLEKSMPAIRLGESDVIGRIRIPRLRLNLMIREGVTAPTLRLAVGHVQSTALPGYPGNVALAAHRDTFFRPLRDIKKGDAITIETIGGNYQYAVDSIDIVSPTTVSVLEASNHPSLTLITCYPFYYVGSAPRRFIVRATQMTPLQR